MVEKGPDGFAKHAMCQSQLMEDHTAYAKTNHEAADAMKRRLRTPRKPSVQGPVEIFNVAHPDGYQNRFWCAAFEVVGTAFLLLAVQWGTVSKQTPQSVGLTVTCFAIILG